MTDDDCRSASRQRGRTHVRSSCRRKRRDSGSRRHTRDSSREDDNFTDGTDCADPQVSIQSDKRRNRGVRKPDPDSDSDSDRDFGATAKQRRSAPTLKLGSYDGSTCLETFLAKFQNCAEYYRWGKADRLFHLRAALEGRAGNVLWEIKPHTTAAELIALLLQPS